MLDKPTFVRRAALVAALPVLSGALIGVAQLVAPAPRGAASNGLAVDAAVPGPTGDLGGEASLSVSVTPSASLSAGSAAGPGGLVVRGRYLMRGPATVPSGASVQFMLLGPVRLVRVDRTAPFTVQLDTRTVPDGDYQLDVATLADGKRSVMSTTRLTVANGVGPPAGSARPAGQQGTQQGTKQGGEKVASAKALPSGTRASRTAGGAASSTAAPSSVPAQTGSYAQQVVVLTNSRRMAHGCPALTVDATLTSVALAHSNDMAARDFFDHVNPDGRSPFDRMTAAGYGYRAAAENIAAGQRTPADVVDAWMNSSGHRANILNCALTQIGVGYAAGGQYGSFWTQDFGTPR